MCKRLAEIRVTITMGLNRQLSLTIAFLVAATSIMFGQEVLLPRAYETTNVGIVYDREVSFPVALHTNGFYFGINSGKLKTYYQTSFWGISLGHLKHPREFKQSNGPGLRNGAGSYIYGKRNNLIPIRAYKGWKRYYSGKDRRRGVAVGTSFQLGLTAGLTKAYTLQIGRLGQDGGPATNRFTTYEDDPVAFLERNRIEGAGGLRRGWSELKIYPGINAKAAVHLDWGAFDEFMRGIDAGIMIDAFPNAIPLLTPEADNQPLFINFYLALQLGKRR